MSRRASPTLIGAFVLGALALFVLALIFFGGGALFRERVGLLTYFPGSVQGLSVGAEVQFQGVTVGQVTAIELDFSPSDGAVRIPVRYEVWPERVRISHGTEPRSARVVLRELVARRGLHARLESLSFVTGQYVVALNLDPALVGDVPAVVADEDGGDVVVPALPAIRDQLGEMLGNLRLDELVDEASAALRGLGTLLGSDEAGALMGNLDATLTGIRALAETLERRLPPLVGRLDQTLVAYERLARRIDGEVVPVATRIGETSAALTRLAERLEAEVGPLSGAARSTLGQASQTLRHLDGLVEDGRGTRVRLDRALVELTRSARALRELADYLERHPEALLRGK
ncbi:MlaD family protein [Marichromatium gracile]|uniref:Mammalian cell entry protein n=1 Tax=Marichromatium gracile TaxID=1048 RepID=A0ABR5VF06_MARGR|nr:MlaD family protein [Marichromatium gracile]KXX64313.1 mammalian cell entry protein [Marichromatium gracile]